MYDVHDDSIDTIEESSADILEEQAEHEECDEEQKQDGIEQDEQEITMDDAINAALTDQPIVTGRTRRSLRLQNSNSATENDREIARIMQRDSWNEAYSTVVMIKLPYRLILRDSRTLLD